MKVSSPSPDVSESASGVSARAPSLRSTVSSSGLRVQTPSERTLLQPSERSPASSTFSFDPPGEQKVHVSVKDMDFELVAPAVPRSPLATSSADSLLVPPANADAKSVIDASPLSLRRPSTDTFGGDRVAKVTDAAEIEAHRQREQRWIAALSSTTPSQARKTKRMRKLVHEGVPASVRYRVWALLTDSKAKRMEGLYARLGQRERIASISSIEQDAQHIFHDQPLLDHSLVNVLQAYLTMVPDVQYTKGLAMVAGQLLLQSPEEDAFWTFVTMMDSHIRPYFSPQPVLLEIDSSLFAKALESNDAALAQRILVEMAIPPICICRPWYARSLIRSWDRWLTTILRRFTALFADAFPAEFLLRVWDIFLFEV
ncbi:hypothetical protein EVJ58_g8759 [Rhodofomes roseus]|uniref:Rab-GAP TBC domain-containing protein n=1 Tax=Rhodofomes roseus TaxID=34475 RepID=A0A4Y9XWW9_9APHY|nr:hypothetical protein EVJ58_g8759 [Rhodofomes roseus]